MESAQLLINSSQPTDYPMDLTLCSRQNRRTINIVDEEKSIDHIFLNFDDKSQENQKMLKRQLKQLSQVMFRAESMRLYVYMFGFFKHYIESLPFKEQLQYNLEKAHSIYADILDFNTSFKFHNIQCLYFLNCRQNTERMRVLTRFNKPKHIGIGTNEKEENYQDELRTYIKYITSYAPKKKELKKAQLQEDLAQFIIQKLKENNKP